MLVDEYGVTSRDFGFRAVPNGVLIDEAGTIQWAKYGGFSIDNDEDVDVVRRFMAGETVDAAPTNDHRYHLSAEDVAKVERLNRQARQFASNGEAAEAVECWRQALHLDPDNLVIRKQIWEAEYPEKFHPVIDFDWQKGQLEQEREDEIAQGICGPDGCPVPSLTTGNETAATG